MISSCNIISHVAKCQAFRLFGRRGIKTHPIISPLEQQTNRETIDIEGEYECFVCIEKGNGWDHTYL